MRFHPIYAMIFLVFLTGCSTTVTNVMNEHGFQRFQPPHKGIEPGTLIVVEDVDEHMVAVTPVCWRRQAFPTLLAPKSNPAIEAELRGNIADSFMLEPAYLKRVQTKHPEIDEIEARLSNPSVLEYTDTALYTGLPSRSKACTDAVSARESNGQTVYTILRVLKGDVTYQVYGKDRTRNVAGKLPQKVLENIKTQIGGSAISTFEQTIKGNALHWGLKQDIIAFESAISDQGDAPPSEMDPVAHNPVPEMETTNTPIPPDAEASSPEAAESDSSNPASSGEEASIPETLIAETADSVATIEEATASAGDLSGPGKAPRLSDEQRKALIKKVAVLTNDKSDADRLKN